MNTSSHISLETLTDIAEDRVGVEVRETAIAHISTCSACEDLLTRLREVIRTSRPLRRIAAILTFDSRNAPTAFGMRSAQTKSRQLLYSAQDSDLELRITVQNEVCIVAGQVLRKSCSGGLVELSGAIGSTETTLNQLCEFMFPAVPLGKYSLTVKMVDLEIEVAELDLTA